MKPFARCSLLISFCLLLISICSLVVAFNSLLVSICSLLVTFCLLLVTFCSLLVTFFSLLVTFILMLVIFCSLLVTFSPLLVTFFSLLGKKIWMKYFLSKSKQKSSPYLFINKKFNLWITWKLGVLSTKYKIIWKFSISGCCNFWVLYKTWFCLQIDMEGFLCSLFIKTGVYSWKHILIEYETFRSYSEHLFKTFILICATVTDSWNKSEKITT